MKPIRPILALSCALALAAPALANTCLQPAEQTALQLRVLQSRLMVGALACQQDASFNEFVRRHQGDLASAYRTAEGHFRRANGAQGQRRWNQVDTEIAAMQSQEYAGLGSFFCRDTTAYFQQTAGLTTGAELARFSVERNVVHAYTAPICPAGAPARARPSRPARRT